MKLPKSTIFCSFKISARFLAIAFLLLLFSSSALAYDESFPVDMSEMVEGLSKSGSTINGGINSTFVSRYVWRGQYYTKGPGWQPEGWVSAYGFIGSVWGSMRYCQEFCVKFPAVNFLKNGRVIGTFPMGFDLQWISILRQTKASSV